MDATGTEWVHTIPSSVPKTNYKNSGITLPKTQFVGPGNRVVDDKGKSNFNSLPDNCADWIALEHDVDYHNAGDDNTRSIPYIMSLDNKAMTNAIKECMAQQPITTSILVGGLKAKQQIENYTESVSWPFGNNNSIYPRPDENGSHINWFDPHQRKLGQLQGEYEISIFGPTSS